MHNYTSPLPKYAHVSCRLSVDPHSATRPDLIFPGCSIALSASESRLLSGVRRTIPLSGSSSPKVRLPRPVIYWQVSLPELTAVSLALTLSPHPGINGFWRQASIEDWPACPAPSSYAPSAPVVRLGQPVSLDSLVSSDAAADFADANPHLSPAEVKEALEKAAFRPVNPNAKHIHLERPAPLALLLSLFGVPTPLISLLPRSWLELKNKWIGELPDQQEREGKVPGCAFHWAKEMHG